MSRLEHVFEAEAIEQLSLKGIARPVLAYNILSAR